MQLDLVKVLKAQEAMQLQGGKNSTLTGCVSMHSSTSDCAHMHQQQYFLHTPHQANCKNH